VTRGQVGGPCSQACDYSARSQSVLVTPTTPVLRPAAWSGAESVPERDGSRIGQARRCQ
jgi:hypothetical protein